MRAAIADRTAEPVMHGLAPLSDLMASVGVLGRYASKKQTYHQHTPPILAGCRSIGQIMPGVIRYIETRVRDGRRRLD